MQRDGMIQEQLSFLLPNQAPLRNILKICRTDY